MQRVNEDDCISRAQVLRWLSAISFDASADPS